PRSTWQHWIDLKSVKCQSKRSQMGSEEHRADLRQSMEIDSGCSSRPHFSRPMGAFRYNRAGQPASGAAMYGATIGNRRYVFADLKTLMAKASPLRSGDQLAGVAAESGEERVAAQFT